MLTILTTEMSLFAAWFSVGLYDVIRLFSEIFIILSAKSKENGFVTYTLGLDLGGL